MFKPDVVWLHRWDIKFFRELREAVPDIRLIIGWVGSSIPSHCLPFFQAVDILFSCAPESVEYFCDKRRNTFHVNHWFAEGVNKKLISNSNSDRRPVIFCGEILLGPQLHLQRLELIQHIGSKVGLTVFVAKRYQSLLKKKNY